MREAASFIAGQTNSAAQGALTSLLQAVRSALQAWNSRRKLATLSDMDDHLLLDIGLDREDVRVALDLPFMQDPGIELQRRAVHNRVSRWGL